MLSKQEIFEAFCKHCIGPVEDDLYSKLMADIKKEILEDQFEFYYSFFEEYIQHSPGSS